MRYLLFMFLLIPGLAAAESVYLTWDGVNQYTDNTYIPTSVPVSYIIECTQKVGTDPVTPCATPALEVSGLVTTYEVGEVTTSTVFNFTIRARANAVLSDPSPVVSKPKTVSTKKPKVPTTFRAP